MDGWIGVDLDSTLAHYEGWMGHQHIGAPIPLMVERVKEWLADGKDVRIFTARVSTDGTEEGAKVALEAGIAIQYWCYQHLGKILPITNKKDYLMEVLYDDRCVQVEENTGVLLGRAK